MRAPILMRATRITTPLPCSTCGDEGITRLLIDRGASADVFAAARLGDSGLVDKCLRNDPACAEARVNRPPFVGPGLHIYGWTLGFDLTPADVARKFGHPQVVELFLSRLPPAARLIDALWCGDAERVRVAAQGLMETTSGCQVTLSATHAPKHI